MEFSANLPVEHFKDLFLHFSELVSLDIRNNQLILSTFNHSRTAQALVRLSPHFFKDYKLLRRGSPETSIQCTIPNKSLNSIIKRNFNSIELIQMCQISIMPATTDTGPRFTMQLVYKNKSKKINNMSYTDGDGIVPLYDKNQLNHFIISTHDIRDSFGRFDNRVPDILLECTPHDITLSSFADPAKNIRPSRYSYSIKSNRCIEYSIIESAKIVVNFKEFQAIVDFADYMEIPVHALFEEVGRPILFIYKLENVLMLDVALMTQNVEEPESTAESIAIDHTSSNPYSSRTNTAPSRPTFTQSLPHVNISSSIFNDQSPVDHLRDIGSRSTVAVISSASQDLSPDVPSTRTNSPLESIHSSVGMASDVSQDQEEPLFNKSYNIKADRRTTLQKLREAKRSSGRSNCLFGSSSSIESDESVYIKQEPQFESSISKKRKQRRIIEESE
ncbi:hypothetical protein INT48_002202 [Thamnidium elegans]|uniref:DNA repair protein rad9 n=1 Tax=Thamnidium elegans TaxID=101142 RepID=A0A8H7T110_9FUNG|nr:hypothetical protein INT48_002202 [Thamnidium elegans]